MIRLGERLLTIAKMAGDCDRPADIGTDHAYIPIYLIQSGACKEAVATDIRRGPLQKASRNIKKYHLEDKIKLCFGNGIEPLQEGECDCFIIAGMGGVVIRGILDKAFQTVKKAKSIIMQPAYAEEVLRQYLYEKGFNIEKEVLVRDEGRLYVILKANYDGIYRKMQLLHYDVGKSLFENKDPLLKEFLERKIRLQTKIVNGKARAKQQDQEELMREQQLLAEMENAYKALL